MTISLAGCGGVAHANRNIAFMGDSITNFWWLPETNYGVPGDVTSQMLARFPSQVLGHHYKAVVILGGTNDMRHKTQTVPQEVDLAISNLQAMAAMAESEKMVVVLCTIPPIRNLNERVVPLNQAIEALAQEHHYKLVDYFTPMVGHPEYFRDGLHPSDEGYFVMQQALAKVLPLDY